MTDINQITILGNLGADPEHKKEIDFTVSSFSVATNRFVKEPSGDFKQLDPEWHKIACYDRLSEKVIDKNIKKGDRVLITGRSQTKKYTDSDSNVKYFHQIVATNMELIQD